jgi:hypothetical protein
MLADEAAREKDIQQRTAQFTRVLNNMKTLAEGRTLPPPATRGRWEIAALWMSPADTDSV